MSDDWAAWDTPKKSSPPPTKEKPPRPKPPAAQPKAPMAPVKPPAQKEKPVPKRAAFERAVQEKPAPKKTSSSNKRSSKKSEMFRAAAEGIMTDFVAEVETSRDKKELSGDSAKATPAEMPTPEPSPDEDEPEKPQAEPPKVPDTRDLAASHYKGGDDDGSSGVKMVLMAVAAVALIVVMYFAFATGAGSPEIFLATNPISDDNYGDITTDDLDFSMGQPIYIYFATGGRLGLTTVQIKILEKVIGKGGAEKLEVLNQSTHKGLQPDWPRLTTHFQREYFDHKGSYIIQILNPAGAKLAETAFTIKE